MELFHSEPALVLTRKDEEAKAGTLNDKAKEREEDDEQENLYLMDNHR